MNQEQFWKHVGTSKKKSRGDLDVQVEVLVKALSTLALPELIDFELHRRTFASAAYRADLWGAAFIINGGCSDDGFEYFRAWLIAQGRLVYDRALANPDSLAPLKASTEAELEEFLYVADRAYELSTGKDDFSTLIVYPAYPTLLGDNTLWSTDGDVDEAKASSLYPRLFRQYFGA